MATVQTIHSNENGFQTTYRVVTTENGEEHVFEQADDGTHDYVGAGDPLDDVDESATAPTDAVQAIEQVEVEEGNREAEPAGEQTEAGTSTASGGIDGGQ